MNVTRVNALHAKLANRSARREAKQHIKCHKNARPPRPGPGAGAGPRAAPATQPRTALHSWQPNTNFNGEQENRLTDFERAARDAGAGERKVTIRKPLGLVLDARPGGDVYVKEITPGGNAEAGRRQGRRHDPDVLGDLREPDVVDAGRGSR